MNPHELVMAWLFWHQAVEYLKHDIPLMESSDTRFPIVYGAYLRLLGKAALTKEQEATKGLRRAGITILGEKIDSGEHFVMWLQRGETEIVRMRMVSCASCRRRSTVCGSPAIMTKVFYKN
jgi:hypothetical protein